MIAQGVSAIVIAPADSKALVSACKRARDAGIIMVNIDNKLDNQVMVDQGIKVPFVGPDNRAGARKVGDFLAKRLRAGDEVVVLEGIRTAFNGQERRLGFEDAMKSAGVKIVDSQTAQWEMDQASRIASAMLGEHPGVKAIICCNDSMALGALAAVKSAGRSGEILIVGFDNIAAIQSAIKDGSVLATADQHADQLAVHGIELALQLLKHENPPADMSTPVDLVTAESLGKP
jgi:ribose transport system substrate-binding protein